MKLINSIKRDFSTMTWVLIPVALAINIVMGQIIAQIKLPVYLDSIGTVLVGVLCGPWAGALTGALSNVIWGIAINPESLPWWPVAMFIGFVAGWCAIGGLFKSWWKVIISGFLIALTAAAASSVIQVVMFGGITGSGSSLITIYLLETGRTLISAVLSTNFLVEPADKIATALLAFAIIEGMPLRLVGRFPRAENARIEKGKRSTEVILAIVVSIIVIALYAAILAYLL